MSKRQILAILGVWVMVFLFLDFPPAWMPWIAVVTGLLIIIVAYRKTPKSSVHSSSSTFVESTPSNQSSHPDSSNPPVQK